MFGHDDKGQNNTNVSAAQSTAPVADGSLGGAPSNDTNASTNTSAPVYSTPEPADTEATKQVNDLPAVPENPSSAGGSYMLSSDDTKDPAASVPAHSDDDELLDIKRDALQQLSPLVSHLDQSPEEKFRTTMMMIQASDDQTLIKAAYDAAKEIADEKEKAQALLDIVNEINYFTQQHSN